MKAIKIIAITSIALNVSIIGGTIGAYFYLRTPAVQEKIKRRLIKNLTPNIEDHIGKSMPRIPEIPQVTGGVVPLKL
tara:strand:+ start:5225 stop:5455 length:231 start_codon:yes stop_codon:yes gene_type:complete